MLKYIIGILGGMMFSLPWLLVSTYFNISFGYLSFLIVIGIILGYKIVNKDIYNDIKTRSYLALSSILIALLNLLLIIPLIVMLKNGIYNVKEFFKLLYSSKQYINSLLLNITVTFCMTLIPALLISLDFKIKNSQKTELEIFIEEIEDIFNRYNAKSKESAISKKVIKKDINNISFSRIKKIFYLDFIRNIYVNSVYDKWYFSSNGKLNSKFGFTILICILISFIFIWNLNVKGITDFRATDFSIVSFLLKIELS